MITHFEISTFENNINLVGYSYLPSLGTYMYPIDLHMCDFKRRAKHIDNKKGEKGRGKSLKYIKSCFK